MFGIGMPEFLLILVVALIVLGPHKLPEMARSIGKALAEFKKSAEALKENLNIGEDLKDVQNNLKDLADPSSYLEPPKITPPVEDKPPGKTEDQAFPAKPAPPPAKDSDA